MSQAVDYQVEFRELHSATNLRFATVKKSEHELGVPLRLVLKSYRVEVLSDGHANLVLLVI
jgi:hypothetical protein